MDPRLQSSSFIPKKPIVTDVRQSRTPLNFFSIISVTIFVIATLASAGVFFYQNHLESELSSASTSLNLSKAEFDPSTLTQLVRLDSRLSVADQLLANHIAVSNFFTELQNVTLQSVRFSDFTFTIGDKGVLTVAMKGEAEDFTSVALQSDALTADTYFSNVMVSDFAVEDSGAVGFDVSLVINPSLISYGASVASQPASSAPSTSNTSSADASNTSAALTATSTNQQTQ